MIYENRRLRHELKYYINQYEYLTLRQRLKAILSQDPHAEREDGYAVRSLYFDDVYDSALVSKNAGVFKRNKYRIRIYNESDKVIKLECKSKYGQYIAKDTALLSRTEYESILGGDISFLSSSDNRLKRIFYNEIKNSLLRPKVIVDYLREAYVLNVGGVRITFDKMLSAGINGIDIFDRSLIMLNAFTKGVMILEIKYNNFLPDYVRSVLQIPSHNKAAISKYVICRELELANNRLDGIEQYEITRAKISQCLIDSNYYSMKGRVLWGKV